MEIYGSLYTSAQIAAFLSFSTGVMARKGSKTPPEAIR